jgi:hypothetical protein
MTDNILVYYDEESDGRQVFDNINSFKIRLKEFGVVESKRNAIRRGFVHELLNAQDTVLCSYFAQRSGTKTDGCGQKSKVEEIFQGLDRFE